MARILFGFVCLLSLLLCAAAVGVTVHSHRAWHSVIWRRDAAAVAERAHPSLGSIWREYRERGRVPGQRAGRWAPPRQLAASGPLTAPPWTATRQYVSLALADGRVEYRRYPETTSPFT